MPLTITAPSPLVSCHRLSGLSASCQQAAGFFLWEFQEFGDLLHGAARGVELPDRLGLPLADPLEVSVGRSAGLLDLPMQGGDFFVAVPLDGADRGIRVGVGM